MYGKERDGHIDYPRTINARNTIGMVDQTAIATKQRHELCESCAEHNAYRHVALPPTFLLPI